LEAALGPRGRANITMSEVVDAIRQVTHIDQTTQQNAALVEEMAAASSMDNLARELVQAASVLKLDCGGTARAIPV
jgi:methyl-accepting chemotaxis protein